MVLCWPPWSQHPYFARPDGCTVLPCELDDLIPYNPEEAPDNQTATPGLWAGLDDTDGRWVRVDMNASNFVSDDTLRGGGDFAPVDVHRCMAYDLHTRECLQTLRVKQGVPEDVMGGVIPGGGQRHHDLRVLLETSGEGRTEAAGRCR